MEVKDAMAAAGVIISNPDVMNALDVLKVQDVMTVLKHLTNAELLHEIQEQSGTIRDSQMIITAATRLLFDRI